MCNKGRPARLIALAILLLFLPAAFGGVKQRPSPLNKVNNWCILIGYDQSRPSANASSLDGYDMVILDPDCHPPLSGIKKKAVLIAYVSVGEAEGYRSYWNRIKEKPWIIGENENWKKNYYVDVRDPEWRELLLTEVIPIVIEKGFRGIMMDTLDTAEYLEYIDPERFKGSQDAMISLVKEIHERFPDLLLISNNGFPLLTELAPCLSGFLVESIHMMPDFKAGGYIPVPEEEYQEKVPLLRVLSKQHGIPVFAIDYVDASDRKKAAECVKRLKKLGFKPCIAQKDLEELPARQ